MDFDINDAKKLARLSRLEYTDDELKDFVPQFEAILQQVSMIDKIDVSNLSLKSNDTRDILELRDDQVVDTFTQEQVLSNAPEKKDGAFLVPLTVE